MEITGKILTFKIDFYKIYFKKMIKDIKMG